MERYGKYRRRTGRVWKRLALLLLLAGLVGGGWWLWQRAQSEDNLSGQPSESGGESQAEYNTVAGRYIFSGTVVLSRAVERAARRADGTYDNTYPFSGMNSFDFDQYDAGIIDLECPSTGRRVPYEVSVANLQFDCHPDYFSEMRKYYQIVNLAHNHTYDAGVAAFDTTVENIQKAGLQAVGRYDPRIKEDLCEVVAMPVRLQKPDGAEEKATLPVAICTFHYQFHLSPQAGELEEIQRYSKVMPTVAMMHAGVENTSTIIPLQREIAQKAIDYGAEFMVGNGAHWVQPTEVYKGKLIAYSTGNFIFDQSQGYDWHIGFNLVADMAVDYDKNVEAWIKLAADCKITEYVDDCLDLAIDRNIAKYQPRWKFDAVGSYGGFINGAYRVTVKANEQQQRDIEQRANWQETLQALGQ